MKAIGYSIKRFEEELLDKENSGIHQIDYLEDSLSLGNSDTAAGYDAAIVFTNDDLSAPVIKRLAGLGVRFVVTRSVGIDHIDLAAARKYSIEVRNIPAYSSHAIAEHAVALAAGLARKLVLSFNNCRDFDFSIGEHMGFTFYGKTVGLIGLGNIGAAAAPIFLGMGCRVLGYDPAVSRIAGVEQSGLDELLGQSDIISLHVPLNSANRHMIDESAIRKMKKGVMLINTSRGGVVKTADVLNALVSGKIGYLGLDVYEFEKPIFFQNHRLSTHKDPMLLMLLNLPNVLITPHQAFLTQEAVTEIASCVIRTLTDWEMKARTE